MDDKAYLEYDTRLSLLEQDVHHQNVIKKVKVYILSFSKLVCLCVPLSV